MSQQSARVPSREELAEWVMDAYRQTRLLLDDLSDEQLVGPQLDIVNPLLWEVGHVAWFHERWVLRDGGRKPSFLDHADRLYDSAAIDHDLRWDLPLPVRQATFDYLRQVRDRVLDRLAQAGGSPQLEYFVQLGIFHQDMHNEAFTYTRQTHAYPPPPQAQGAPAAGAAPLPAGDVEVAGGSFRLGAERDAGFVFDNEKWAHEVRVEPFAIARAAVTEGEFRDFVDDGGYRRRELWSAAGWRWRQQAAAEQPLHWRRQDGVWQRRIFDRWQPLDPQRTMIHVNWHEAQAYCRWAGRRLPTEAEWELAAAGSAGGAAKRRFPWGDEAPSPERANLDWQGGYVVDAAAHPAGDSADGCRQMIGNAWEWTASDFEPYPGFEPDPYKEYSAPWFGTHKVLRGGAWTTRSRMLRNTWRNYYTPDRRDVWAGFRTCRR
ncbi:MAG: ergothioneine biosynthesis protein EgtB [Acidobacteria bacterium]|nr:MAG: ergothioneine biosynthesis protein EgtB [Acidobacteriota bacterium]